MVKHKKKRTKKYRGADAANSRPTVTKMQAVNRGRLGQYWYERKRVLKPVLTTIAVVLVVIVLVIELVRVLVSGTI